MGVHQQALVDAVSYADKAFWFMQDQDWQLAAAAGEQVANINTLIQKVAATAASTQFCQGLSALHIEPEGCEIPCVDAAVDRKGEPFAP